MEANKEKRPGTFAFAAFLFIQNMRAPIRDWDESVFTVSNQLSQVSF